MIYTMISTQYWIVQDASDFNSFSLAVNEDPGLIGEYMLRVQVRSADYPNNIDSKIIDVPISVRCTIPYLINEQLEPKIWEPQTIDEIFSMEVPIYYVCSEPWSNLNFKFYEEIGTLRHQITWVRVDALSD